MKIKKECNNQKNFKDPAMIHKFQFQFQFPLKQRRVNLN